MAYEHMKKYLTSLAIKEMQVKTKMRYYYTPITTTNTKNSNNTMY